MGRNAQVQLDKTIKALFEENRQLAQEVVHKEPVDSISRMAKTAHRMLGDIIDSYLELNIEKAVEVWHRDDQIDAIFAKMIEDIRMVMSKDPDRVNSCTSLLFFAKACERIGDHITNIAENVYYVVTGQIYRGESYE